MHGHMNIKKWCNSFCIQVELPSHGGGIVKPPESTWSKEAVGCMSVSATWWYNLPQKLARINLLDPDYAAAIGNRMSLTESDGPCKNELR